MMVLLVSIDIVLVEMDFCVYVSVLINRIFELK